MRRVVCVINIVATKASPCPFREQNTESQQGIARRHADLAQACFLPLGDRRRSGAGSYQRPCCTGPSIAGCHGWGCVTDNAPGNAPRWLAGLLDNGDEDWHAPPASPVLIGGIAGRRNSITTARMSSLTRSPPMSIH